LEVQLQANCRERDVFLIQPLVAPVQEHLVELLLRIPVQQAEAFAEKLRAAGVRYRFKEFPGAPHGIPIDDQYREVYPFLDEFLR